MNAGNKTAALYVVATPLGNIADISQRALETLRTVAAIACEDTRHTRHLLDHYGIRTATFALHEHNEAAAANKLIELLAAGKSVALVSDAGTPAISDPGARAVAAVHAAGFPVIPLPGPNAAVTALSAAGLEDARLLVFCPARQLRVSSKLPHSSRWPPPWCFMKRRTVSRKPWPTWPPCSNHSARW
jgi:16S rRNA (cytidine1402-2'-O)-methyltransferase